MVITNHESICCSAEPTVSALPRCSLFRSAEDERHTTQTTLPQRLDSGWEWLCCGGDSYSTHAAPDALARRVRPSSCLVHAAKAVIFTCCGKYYCHTLQLSGPSGDSSPLTPRRCPARASLQPDSTPHVVWAKV